ncbi:hypothetical protein B0H13DRAFT_1888513 [Mycena leptocephala]|nr:hypothetical protein B0H13DRAFT_1888513 [Mycena leptocephala]
MLEYQGALALPAVSSTTVVVTGGVELGDEGARALGVVLELLQPRNGRDVLEFHMFSGGQQLLLLLVVAPWIEFTPPGQDAGETSQPCCTVLAWVRTSSPRKLNRTLEMVKNGFSGWTSYASRSIQNSRKSARSS